MKRKIVIWYVSLYNSFTNFYSLTLYFILSHIIHINRENMRYSSNRVV